MNGPRVQVHRREGKRRSPDPGDLRAIYGGHPDRVPVTARARGPVVRRDLAATPDRAARRRVTIISAPAGVLPGGARGVPRGRAPATSAGGLTRSEQPDDWLAAGHPGSASADWRGPGRARLLASEAFSGHSRSSARNPVAAKVWSRARRSPASGRVSGRRGRNGSAAESHAQNLWIGALAVAR